MFPALVLSVISIAAAPPVTVAATDSVLRLVERTPGEAPGQWRVSFRDRGARASYAERMGVGAVDGAARVDCNARRFQLEELVLYAEPRGGEPLARIGPRAEWRAAAEDTLLARVVEATCAPGGSKASQAGAKEPPAEPQRAPVAAPPPSVRPTAARVQLGAFATHQQALQGWGRVRAARGLDFAGLSPQVETTTVGGRTYHRLLVGGFASRDAARDLCRRLTVSGHPCFLRH